MKFLKNRRFIFLFLGLLIVVGLAALYLLAAAPQTPSTTSPIPTRPPVPTIGLTPASQRLIVNWNNLTLKPPLQLATYTVASPLIDDRTVAAIADILGFRTADLKPSLKETSKLYVRNNVSLFASTSQNQILFNTTGSLPPRRGISSTILEQKALTYLRQFFPDQTFVKSATEYFYATNSIEAYPEAASQQAANLVRFSYQQTINDYPLLTLAAKNAIISFTFDSNLTLRSLEISGGFSSTELAGEFAVLDLPTLKIQAPKLAIAISHETTIDNQSLIANQLSLTLNLDRLQLVYFTEPDSRQIVPVFLLTGTLKGNFPDTPAAYLVPALR